MARVTLTHGLSAPALGCLLAPLLAAIMMLCSGHTCVCGMSMPGGLAGYEAERVACGALPKVCIWGKVGDGDGAAGTALT